MSSLNCFYCERRFGLPVPNNGLPLRKTRDHIIALCKRGVDSDRNIVLACQKCNSMKGAMLPEEFSQYLIYRIKRFELGIQRKSMCYSLPVLKTMLANNEMLIKKIAPYRSQLFKTAPKSLKEITNKIKQETLHSKKDKKKIKRLKAGVGFFENPIALNLFIEKHMIEPEENFHY